MWPFSQSLNFLPDRDIPDLSGRVILVTGGNTGIGKETILQLAKHQPAHIYLAARSESRAENAITDIRGQVGEAVKIDWLPLDLTSLTSIKNAADKFNREQDRLDILINNAGVLALPPGTTASGQDNQLGTNHVGHHLLFKLLRPRLEATAALPGSDVRVITVSSEAHLMSPPIETITSTEKLVLTGPWTRYGASKAANILFATELARRHPSLTSVSVHPGIIKTDLYNTSASTSWVLKQGLAIFGRFVFIDIPTGALTQLWAAAGTEKGALKNGGYYTPVGKARNNQWTDNEIWAKQLWDWTDAELAKEGY